MITASVSKLYESLQAQDREPYLRRGRVASRYTIPYLCPPSGFNHTHDLPSPYQGLGQRGVRNIASKFLLTILPPNEPFLKLDLTPESKQEAQGSEGDFDVAFRAVERMTVEDINVTDIRTRMFEALMQLIVVGNVLLQYKKNGSFIVHKLHDFVVKRRPDGEVKFVILRRKVLPSDLPDEVRSQLAMSEEQMAQSEYQPERDSKLDLYTVIVNEDDKRWSYHQEVNGILIPGSEGSDPFDSPTYQVLRMVTIDGENYGRGYVEEMLGDLISYDALNQHILEGAAAMAKLLIIRRPNSVIRAKDLELPNLSTVTGNPDEVSVLQMQKGQDFSVALQLAGDLKERLEFSFLLTTAIQRNAERVTAEEIRTMAQELEDSLGGLYSTLSHDIQVPLANRVLRRLRQRKALPKEMLDRDVVTLTITTGLAALGRGHDLQKLRMFMQDLGGLAQAAQFLPELNRGEAIKRIAASYGIDQTDLILSQEEVEAQRAAEQQQAQMMQLAQTALSSGAATELTKAATGAMQQNAAA